VSDSPVLVVGAGPTGLLLASELCRRNVPCVLIDARPEAMHWDRATVVHPRSLQIFEAIGVVDQLLEAGCRQRVVKVYSDGEKLGEIDLSTSGSLYGFNVGLSEEVVESILTGYLEKHGGVITRSSRLIAFRAQGEEGTATIDNDGRQYELKARWLVGCDGIHSITRELAKIDFEGHKFARQWAVFDAAVEGWNDTYEGIFVYHDLLPIILTALPGKRWRIYLRPSSETTDLVAEATATLRRYVPTASFADIENPTRFNCFTKIAAQYRSGVMLLAGDAAHLCSPSEGHGMNTGLQDAFNLAWKLALVYHGVANPSLLDTYQLERRPIAEAITLSGDGFEQSQLITDPAEREKRNQGIRGMLADPARLHHHVLAETELAIDYTGSPIVQGDFNESLAAGVRLPDTLEGLQPGQKLHQLAQHAGHTLLLLAGVDADREKLSRLHFAMQAATADSPLFETTAIGHLPLETAQQLGVRDVTLLAVRPDGYIGLRSDHDHLAALDAYRKLIQGVSFTADKN
jgi:2-polyprenyl-6-methoxyphenol hydroxylase-like FAD-dependent oxidoreductase